MLGGFHGVKVTLKFKIMKYLLKAVCFIVAMTAFCILLGEPAEELKFTDVVVIKSISLLALWGVFKAYMCTLSDKERKELEDERV